MNQSLWRRGGLVDFASLEFRSKAVLIFVFILFQFVALAPVGLIVVFVSLTYLVFPFFGLISPTFMEDEPAIVGYGMITFLTGVAFLITSLPLAIYINIPSKIILILALLAPLEASLFLSVLSRVH